MGDATAERETLTDTMHLVPSWCRASASCPGQCLGMLLGLHNDSSTDCVDKTLMCLALT